MPKLVTGMYYRLSDEMGNSLLYRAISEERLAPVESTISRICLDSFKPSLFDLRGLKVEPLPHLKLLGDEHDMINSTTTEA